MAQKKLEKLIRQIEDKCEIKIYSGFYVQLLEECFKGDTFSHLRKDRDMNFVVANSSNLWSNVHANWKVFFLFLLFLAFTMFAFSKCCSLQYSHHLFFPDSFVSPSRCAVA